MRDFPSVLRRSKFLPGLLRQAYLDRFWQNFWRSETSDQPDAIDRFSERPSFLETVASFAPFDRVLEVGCGYGQNFGSLTRLFPEVSFHGIDIDRARIDFAKQQFLDSPQVHFEVMDIRELSKFSDASFDLVISSAFLLYVSSSEIEGVIDELYRIASKAIVLLEQHQGDDTFANQHLGRKVAPQRNTPAYWVRDYKKLLEARFPLAGITMSKVQKPSWRLEQWQELGTILAVTKP